MPALLRLFLLLRLAQQVVETALARLNRRHALEPVSPRGGRPCPRHRRRRDGEGGRLLGRPPPLRPRLRLGGGRGRRSPSWPRAASASSRAVRAGSRGHSASARSPPASPSSPSSGTLTALFELPFDLYATFRIEEKHGFNRQTLGGFFLDRLKGVAHRDRPRRADARRRALADGADGALLVALGLGRHDRLQPLRRLDLPDRPRAPLQQVHPAARRRAQGRDPRPRAPHRLPRGRHLGHGRLAPHRPRQRLLHRRLRPEAHRPLRHPPRGDGPARGGRGAGPRARPLQAAPRALGHGPRHRDERPRLLRR